MNKCTNCNVDFVENAKFCHNCGSPVERQIKNGNQPTLFGGSVSRDESVSDSLKRLMPAEYIDKLMASRGQLEGERRIVTILFSDVKGSTSLAENLDPEEVLEIMNGAFDVLIEPITKYEGTIARLMGDAILAFFGAPIAHEDDPVRACRAALDILEGAEKFSEKLKEEKGIEGFAVRVGINTGLVVVAEVGADLRVEYTAMGDAVNIAARMESAADPNTVLITEETKKLIDKYFDVDSLGPISVKGKSQPLNVFRLLDYHHQADSRINPQGIRSQIVGREKELEKFNDSFKDLINGKGSIVSIIGEQGIGKSRLVEEMKIKFKDKFTWAEGRALAYTHGDSYWVARDLLNNLFGLKIESKGVEAHEKLRSFMEMFEKDEFLEIYPYLLHFLNISADQKFEKNKIWEDPEALKGQIYFAYREFVKKEAARKPLVLVWEDMHWSDQPSLTLLNFLLTLIHDVPVLFLLLFRNNEGGIWDSREVYTNIFEDHYNEIKVLPLNKDESIKLLENLLEGHSLPAKFQNQIIEKTEGNAFFIEEVLRSLIDRKMIQLTEGKLTVDITDEEFKVPNHLQSVIMARIDSLEPVDKLALQTASVIGRTFHGQLLKKIMHQSGTGSEFEKEVDELKRREFILARLAGSNDDPKSASELEYIFKQSLTQDVVYDTLLKSHRKKIHNYVGEAIEELYDSNNEEYAGTLAYHFEKGGEFLKAIKYYKIAGSNSKKIFANREAVYSYLKALELYSKTKGPKTGVEEIHEALGNVYFLTSEYSDAISHYEMALEFFTDSQVRSSVFLKCGQVYERWGFYDKALSFFDTGLDELSDTGDNIHRAKILAAKGMVYYRLNQIDNARIMNEEALKILETKKDSMDIGDVYNNLGIIYSKEDNIKEAMKYHQKCLKIRRDINHLSGLAGSYNNIGFLYHRQDDFDMALEHYQMSIELCQKLGNLHGLAKLYDNISHIHISLENENEAMEYNLKAVELLGKISLSGEDIHHDIWLQSGVW
jgi:class 3 adenylate cyclase/predicted ATPase